MKNFLKLIKNKPQGHYTLCKAFTKTQSESAVAINTN